MASPEPPTTPESRLLSPDLEVLWVARFDYHPGDAVGVHDHDYCQMVLILDGQGHWLPDASKALAADQLAILPPVRPHGLHADSTVRSLDIKFQIHHPPLAQAFAALPALLDPAPATAARHLHAVLAAAQDGPRRDERSQAALQVLLLEMMIAHQDPAVLPLRIDEAIDPVVRRLLAIFHEHLDQPLEGPAMERLSGYSYRHLSARCREEYACTPKELLRRQRLARARELLLFSDLPVKAVAQRCGFATVHHFTRCFSAAEGEGPASWRSRHGHAHALACTVHRTFTNQLLVRGEGDEEHVAPGS